MKNVKAISAHRGYRGLYEIFPECLIVTVYKDGYEYEKLFGFTINNQDEAEIEYQFRLNVESYISHRPQVYADLKMRHEKQKKLDTITVGRL